MYVCRGEVKAFLSAAACNEFRANQKSDGEISSLPRFAQTELRLKKLKNNAYYFRSAPTRR